MERIAVYTDGSATPSSSGWAVICPHHHLIFRGKLEATNQQAELIAIIRALEFFGPNIHIHTDSMYCIGLFTQNWSPKKNIELIRYAKELGADQAKYAHVKAHSGIVYNEMADYYAKGKTPQHQEWILYEK